MPSGITTWVKVAEVVVGVARDLCTAGLGAQLAVGGVGVGAVAVAGHAVLGVVGPGLGSKLAGLGEAVAVGVVEVRRRDGAARGRQVGLHEPAGGVVPVLPPGHLVAVRSSQCPDHMLSIPLATLS